MRDASNSAQLLLEGELGSAVGTTFRKTLLRRYLTRFPSLLRERQAPTALLRPYDKVFAAAWLWENIVAVGTKSNHLLLVDVHKYIVQEVQLPLVPRAPPRDTAASANPYGSCGIHAIAVNPTGNLLATGGSRAEDTAVIELPSCNTAHTLVGHTDWVFGVAWLTDVHLATGSRDKNIKLWRLPFKNDLATATCLMTVSSNQGKVRDIKYGADVMRMVSLGTEGVLTTWDAQGGQVRSVRLVGSNNPVCLAMQGPLVAAGTEAGTALFDVRAPSQTGFMVSLDPDGIRSISFNQHMLACGGASSMLFFYDIRKHAVLEVTQAGHCESTDMDAERKQQPPTRMHSGVTGLAMDNLALKLGRGYVHENDTYREFAYLPSQPACYAHCWDQYGMRLFAAGGPSLAGFRGCYMAMWE